MSNDRIEAAYQKVLRALWNERHPDGYWVGELSASALSTATAVVALTLAKSSPHLVTRGIEWLSTHQNSDGGWGDTVLSKSNISTTMLCRAAFHISGRANDFTEVLHACEAWLALYGRTPSELAEAVRQRYGKDRTFSVPILMMCALARLVPWNEVPRLPFELACLPQSWYRFARLPVVSYALPALIAIGQVIHQRRANWNPITGLIRWLSKGRSLRVLERIQPSSGGYLEAIPLTSFVVMSLAEIRPSGQGTAADRVREQGVKFLIESALTDGSWAIDSNLSIWLTTLSINALNLTPFSLQERGPCEVASLLDWLLEQQTKTQHPFTGAAPGAWGWSHLPGSVPDCDDTPGAVLAVHHLQQATGRDHQDAIERGVDWILQLQNSDGGWPTFCKGWGKLPFDRSGSDLTAHALRAIQLSHRSNDPKLTKATKRGLAYLARLQRPDGSWLPLWFGNQHAPDDINPVYGTARVLAVYRDLGLVQGSEAQRGIAFLYAVQNTDGGWGGALGCESSIEETALVLEILLGLEQSLEKLESAAEFLLGAIEENRFTQPAPIGFYFAKLWYFEKLYPIIFCLGALGKLRSVITRGSAEANEKLSK